MNSIIDLLLEKTIQVDQLFLWLRGEFENPQLELLDTYKAEFPPSFLNYLRDQTSGFLNTTSANSLTPGKFTPSLKYSKYFSPNKRDYASKGSTKAKALDFSDSSAPNKKKAGCLNSKESHSIANGIQSINLTSPTKNAENSVSLLLSPVSSASPSSCYSSLNNESKTFSRNNQPNSFCQSPESIVAEYSTPLKQRFSPLDASTPGYRNFPSRKGYNIKSFIKKKSFDDGHSEHRFSDCKINLSEFIVEHKKGRKKSATKTVNSDANIRETKDVESSFDISDLESFPPMGSNLSKQSPKKKRIAPTLVSSSSCLQNNQKNYNHSSFNAAIRQSNPSAFLVTEELDSNTLENERRQLKKELKEINKKEITRNFSTPKSKDSSVLQLSKKTLISNCIQPIYEKVTYKNELNILSSMYAHLILYNMVPNIMIELYYLFQLLTLDSTEEFVALNECDDLLYINSVHNCVYFAVQTLPFVFNYICHLDRTTVKLLRDNSRIRSFNSAFHRELIKLSDSQANVKSCIFPPKSPILSVSFQTETDNRSNFPSSVDFQAFRKQRDMFYEVIRIWEMNHLTPDWDFAVSLGTKVQSIMNLKAVSTNFMHFARLFHCQLVTMCKGNEQTNPQSDLEGLSFLSQLRRDHPEKYQKLHERLITPSKFGGPVPLPSFPGAQEFFHDFIIVASNHLFNSHLKDSLISRILQLNDIEFQLSEIEDGEGSTEYMKERVWSSLQNLRLLAKFLGFLEFLPYQTTGHIPVNILTEQIILRNNVSPPLSLLKVLRKAATSGSLVVSVSWVVEYLSMVDPIALHTRFYLTIILVLVFIYRMLYIFNSQPHSPDCQHCQQLNKRSFISSSNSFCLKLLLGWLFSLPQFPEGLFYATEDETDISRLEYEETCNIIRNSYTNICFNCQKMLNECHLLTESSLDTLGISDFLTPIKGVSSPMKSSKRTPTKATTDSITPLKTPKKFNSMTPLKTPTKLLQVSMVETPDVTPLKDTDEAGDPYAVGRKDPIILDSISFFDTQMVFMCCPYIVELKSMLSEFSIAFTRSRTNNFRKITPLSSNDKTNEQPERNLQLQLEDNFFHNKPSSMRKTVDFLAERIHSNILRQLRSSVFPKLKDKYVAQLKTDLSSHILASPGMGKISEIAEKKVLTLSQDLAVDVKAGAFGAAEEILNYRKMLPSVEFLLPSEVSTTSCEMCCRIVKRMVLERVMVFVNTHLSPSLYHKELTLEANKFIKQVIKSNLSFTNIENTFEDRSVVAIKQSINKESSDSVDAEADDVIRSPAEVLSQLKSDILNLMVAAQDAKPPTEEYLLATIESIPTAVAGRRDSKLPFFKALETLSADWIVAHCVCVPEVISVKVLDLVILLWSPIEDGGLFPSVESLSCLLSARTFMLLGQRTPECQSLAWGKMELFTKELVIVRKLMTPTAFQEHCIALLRYSWPQAILTGISSLIKNTFNQIKKDPDFRDDPDVLQMLDWVGWICDQMES